MERFTQEAEKKENRVSRMSVQEYAARKGVELQPIQFYGFPCRHAGEDPAKEIISSLELIKPDLVLIENVDNFVGINYQKILERIKKDDNYKQDIETSDVSFAKVLLEYLLSQGIEVHSIDRKFESKEKAKDNHKVILSRMSDARPWVSRALKEIDDEKAWQVIMRGWEDIKLVSLKLQREREEVMLSSIAPIVSGSPNSKKIKKVAIIVGAEHRSGVFESMTNRGDNVRLQESHFVRNREIGKLSSFDFPSYLLATIIGSSGMDGGIFLAPWGSDHFVHEVKTGEVKLTLEDVKQMFMKLRRRNLKKEDLIVSQDQ
jgi:hypothetical protein